MELEQTLIKKIKTAGQEHLLRYWSILTEQEQQEFASQLEAVNFDILPELINKYVLNRPQTAIPDDLGPAPFFPLNPRSEEEKKRYEQAEKEGKELLKSGRVCCLTVAGGQGTRLGFDGPKGSYPIGPVSGRPLFAYFAQNILRAGEKYGKPITWYIMTSKLNNQDTVTFFRQNNFFSLQENQVFFFVQGTMPAIGYDGKLLMANTHSLSLSPDGHGGTLLALRKSGALDRMKQEGTDIISYFQVDNPLVHVVDPLFIGMHVQENAQMSAVMLSKTGPFEKLGNFCVSDGRLQIIEYSDLPEELAEKRNPDGTLAFVAGSPAIHLIQRDFVEELTSSGTLSLPWHRADKKIPFIDDNGVAVSPSEPNGVKLESFIFDALPLATRTMVMEFDRAEGFAPTKNPTGVDSAESCRQMLIDRDIKRLASAGVTIPRKEDGTPDVTVEVSPRLVLDAEDAALLAASRHIDLEKGMKVVIE
ncbi:MAG: UDPGP type 1 family protein, partial [Lentisphaeria bacterium]|nr:UDPGP type 1 family protein [Lentisphaeria bacterium]